MNIDFSAVTKTPSEDSKLNLNLPTEGYNRKKLLSSLFSGITAGTKALLSGKNGQWNQDVNTKFLAFASANSFKYTFVNGTFFTANNALPISSLHFINDKKKLWIIRYLTGLFLNYKFEYYSGIFARDAGSFNGMQITVPFQLNKLYVGQKKNFQSDIKDVILDIKQMEERQLEGDFSKFYNVFSQKDDSLTAHYILSPEVMNKLLQNKMFDIWIEDNRISFFSLVPSMQIYLENVQDFFEFAEMLIKNVDVIKNSSVK